MVRNGLKRSTVVQNDRNYSIRVPMVQKSSKFVQNSSKQSQTVQMVQNGPEWSKMFFLNFFFMVKICQNCSKWSKMVQYGSIWSNMVQNTPKCSFIVQNCPKYSKCSKSVQKKVFFCLFKMLQ